MGIRSRLLPHPPSLLAFLSVALISACTNGGLATTQRAASISPPLQDPSFSGGLDQYPITPAIVGVFTDNYGPQGPGGKGILLNIEKSLNAVLEINNSNLGAFLNQVRTDPAFAAQKLRIILPNQKLRIEIPFSRLVSSTGTPPTLYLNSGVIVRANGSVSVVRHPDLPDSAAGLHLYGGTQLFLFGGIKDRVPLDKVVNFSLNGGTGVVLTNDLLIPVNATYPADETVVLPTHADLLNDLSPSLKTAFDEIRFDHKYLHISSDKLSCAYDGFEEEPFLRGRIGATPGYVSPYDLLPSVNPDSVYVVQRRKLSSGYEMHLLSVCGFLPSGTGYRCATYYSRAISSSTLDFTECVQNSAWRPTIGNRYGMDSKKQELLGKLNQSLSALTPPFPGAIPGGFSSAGITVTSY